jgi:hypothetical protein
MKRQEILDTAKQAVTKDRAATHGDAESSFAEIGKIWGIRLGAVISPEQVAIMLTDLKTVRAWHNPTHADNWVDLAGYAACGGEIGTTVKPYKPGSFVETMKQVDEVLKAGAALFDFDFGPIHPWIPVGALKSVTVDTGERVELKSPDAPTFKITTYTNNTIAPVSYYIPDHATHYRILPVPPATAVDDWISIVNHDYGVSICPGERVEFKTPHGIYCTGNLDIKPVTIATPVTATHYRVVPA